MRIIYGPRTVIKTFLRTRANIKQGWEILRRHGNTSIKFTLLMIVLMPTALFLHLAFRHSYLPALEHSRQLHFTFRSCENEAGMCSFPTAHVKLTKRHQFLAVGQSYKMTLNLEMPESEANRNLGMFMCCTELRSRRGYLTASSCRSSMLVYRSPLMTFIETVVLAPLMILGYRDEKQYLAVELFSNLEDDQNEPITDIHVEIQSKQIQLYSASLMIEANFSGLRYLLYKWPYISAITGTGFNLFFMLVICLLSWYRWQTVEYDYIVKKEESFFETEYDDDFNKFDDDTDIKKEIDSGEHNQKAL